MIVVPGPASTSLGEEVARRMGVEPLFINHKIFPDGENYIRVTGEVEGETVAFVQTTAPEPDRKLMQAFLLARTLGDLGARRVVAVIPYLAYARQDKRFLRGEALSLDVVLGLLEASGVSDLVVVDVHNEESLSNLENNHRLRVTNVSAVNLLAGYMRDTGFQGALSLSPDLGRRGVVEKASKVLGGGMAFFEKTRDRVTGETAITGGSVEVEGRDVVVFDDIISSGGTMSKAIQALRELGARRVAAACTHVLPVPGAFERLRNAGAVRVVATDTVESSYETVSVAGLLAEALQGLDR